MDRHKAPHFQSVLNARLKRRSLVKKASLLTAGLAMGGCSAKTELTGIQSRDIYSLSFEEVPQGLDQQLTVPADYAYDVLVRWGDPLFAHAPAFDPHRQSAAKQTLQFGFNNDFVGFLPLPEQPGTAQRAVLVVNHEYTNPALMFPESPSDTDLDLAQTDIDIAAHGMSVLEIRRQRGQWHIDTSSPLNRRITPLTSMVLSGPAAGHSRLKTAYSQDGIQTRGTYGNCSGGITPWGTVLSGEENIDYMFAGDFSLSDENESLTEFGMKTEARKSWAKYYDRWDMSKNPRESLHMGWIVEVDPFNPRSVPKKRTALGRFKHEGCNVYINHDNLVIAYSGDDQKSQYLYKFVSDKPFQSDQPAANIDLLDSGTLYCARFFDDGTVHWLPLTYGTGPLTSANNFHSQADVCIDTRKAATLLGATPMDRPEDVEVNPVTGSVFVMLTKNKDRSADQTDGVNPRANNRSGQIVELFPPGGDHAATQFSWEMFLLAGKKDDASTNYHSNTTENGWLACPDNCAFDNEGNLWISTDGAGAFGIADGVWVTAVKGQQRALTKRFLRAPTGAEVCGPCFTPNNDTFFCAIQHPGEYSRFEQPSTRWPDNDNTLPPRPSVVAIHKKSGGPVGS